jgi:glutathionyl-hydroquinone reductase
VLSREAYTPLDLVFHLVLNFPSLYAGRNKAKCEMGMLVDGEWHDVWYDTSSTGGRFERKASDFRNWVTPDGTPGPTGAGGFPAERERYHLYVSLACPWAHRTLIMRRLKGLEDAVSFSVVHWRMRERGWTFTPGPCVTGDQINGAETLSQIYVAADPHYTPVV